MASVVVVTSWFVPLKLLDLAHGRGYLWVVPCPPLHLVGRNRFFLTSLLDDLLAEIRPDAMDSVKDLPDLPLEEGNIQEKGNPEIAPWPSVQRRVPPCPVLLFFFQVRLPWCLWAETALHHPRAATAPWWTPVSPSSPTGSE